MGKKNVRRYIDWNNDLQEFEGPMYYQESAKAWNTLRFRQGIIEGLPVLRDKQNSIHYKALVCRTKAKLDKVLQMIRNDKVPMPLMLFFYTEGGEMAVMAP